MNLFFRKYRRSVFIVAYKIENKTIRYLIQKRKLHWKGYEFPKGGIEKNEKDISAVKREIFEETGLLVKKIKNHHRWGYWKYKKPIESRPNVVGQTWKLYSVEVMNSKVLLDKREHTSFEWLNYSDSLKKLTHENQKKCLKIVNSWILKHICD